MEVLSIKRGAPIAATIGAPDSRLDEAEGIAADAIAARTLMPATVPPPQGL